MNTGAEPGGQAAEIPRSMDRLVEKIANLSDRVKLLQGRLEKVLRPAAPSLAGENAKVEQALNTGLAIDLNDRTRHVGEIQDNVNDMIDRLEL